MIEIMSGLHSCVQYINGRVSTMDKYFIVVSVQRHTVYTSSNQIFISDSLNRNHESFLCPITRYLKDDKT